MSELLPGNLFRDLPDASCAEQFECLATLAGVRIERIVSQGQASAPDEWFDQDGAEWVVLLQGAATLDFEDSADLMALMPGDHVFIAPHRRHRVHWTMPDATTIWLAVHLPG